MSRLSGRRDAAGMFPEPVSRVNRGEGRAHLRLTEEKSVDDNHVRQSSGDNGPL